MLDPMIENGLHNRLGDYGANVELFHSPDDAPSYGTAQPPLAAAAITRPSQIISVLTTEQLLNGSLIGSWVLSTYLYVNQGSAASASQSLPSDRGTNNVQCLFADGHIEAIPKATLTDKRRSYLLLNP